MISLLLTITFLSSGNHLWRYTTMFHPTTRASVEMLDARRADRSYFLPRILNIFKQTVNHWHG